MSNPEMARVLKLSKTKNVKIQSMEKANLPKNIFICQGENKMSHKKALTLYSLVILSLCRFTNFLIFSVSRMPYWLQAICPRVFYVIEKSWNYYPFTITGNLNIFSVDNQSTIKRRISFSFILLWFLSLCVGSSSCVGCPVMMNIVRILTRVH